MLLKSTTLKNSLFLGLDRISAMATSFIVGVIIARNLGTEVFGIYSFALSIINIFLSIGNAGLSSLLVRDLVLRPDEESKILGSAIALKSIVSLLSTLGVVIFSLMAGINNKEYLVLLILSFVIPLNVVSILEYWFQSKRKVLEYVICKSTLLLIFLSLKIWIVLKFESLVYFSYIHILYFVFLFLTLLLIFQIRSGLTLNKLSISKSWCFEYLKNGSLIFLSTIITIFYLKSDIIMIKYLSDLNDVGNYSAATQISELWYIFPTLIMTAYFPLFAKSYNKDSEDSLKNIQIVLQVFLITSIVISIIISFTSTYIITIIFGSEFKSAISVLVVQIWSSIFVFQRIAVSKLLILEGMFRFSLFTQLIGLTLNIVLNFLMFDLFGVVGVALATLLAYFISNYLVFAISSKTRYIFILMNKSFISLFKIKEYSKTLKILKEKI